jgi:toxin ParE1/3/4
MKYQIIRTDKANDQLYEIINYIVDESGSVDIGLNYLNKIEETVMKLEEYPCVGSYPRYSILKRQGYRVLIVEKHLIFYKVNEIEKIVVVHAIVDTRREYRNLI